MMVLKVGMSGKGKKRAEGGRKRWVYRNVREGEKVREKSNKSSGGR